MTIETVRFPIKHDDFIQCITITMMCVMALAYLAYPSIQLVPLCGMKFQGPSGHIATQVVADGEADLVVDKSTLDCWAANSA